MCKRVERRLEREGARVWSESFSPRVGVERARFERNHGDSRLKNETRQIEKIFLPLSGALRVWRESCDILINCFWDENGRRRGANWYTYEPRELLMPKPARHNNEKCKQMLRAVKHASWCAFNFIFGAQLLIAPRLTGIRLRSQLQSVETSTI